MYADSPVSLYLDVPNDLDPLCTPYSDYEIIENDQAGDPVPTEYVTLQFPDPRTITIAVTSAQMDDLGGH